MRTPHAGVRFQFTLEVDDVDAMCEELSLDEDASNTLLDLGAATLPVDLRRRILEEAAGNPLALIELPAAAAELGTHTLQSGPLPLTARLEQAFASRLTTLDTDVQRLNIHGCFRATD